MAIKKGDKIQVAYEGKFDDGTIFDTSNKEGSGPIEFEVGANQVIPAFDNSVLGMEKDEEKEFKIQPSEGYGERRDELIKELPLNAFPVDNPPKKGMMFMLKSPEGQQIPAIVYDVTQDKVKIDLNHPLSGKVLNFKIKIVSIN